MKWLPNITSLIFVKWLQSWKYLGTQLYVKMMKMFVSFFICLISRILEGKIHLYHHNFRRLAKNKVIHWVDGFPSLLIAFMTKSLDHKALIWDVYTVELLGFFLFMALIIQYKKPKYSWLLYVLSPYTSWAIFIIKKIDRRPQS